MSTLKVGGTFLATGKEQVMKLLGRESRDEDAGARGVMFIAIGDGTPTPTGLGRERGRRGIYSCTKPESGKRVFRAVFESGYPPQDMLVTEVGLVCEGSLTTNTGVCIAAISLASPVIKRAIDYLYVDYTLYFG